MLAARTMNSTRMVVAVSALLFTLSASAQQTNAPAPPAAAPARAPAIEMEYESIRFRGGLTVGGGAVFGPVGGPIIDVSVRLGVQLGRYFGILLQEQPNLFLISNSDGLVAGFGINNSLLAELTLFDHLQLAAGPSFDYLAGGGCSDTCTAGAGLGFGLHARAAFVFGGRDPQGGRRSGFSLSVNLHPLFFGGTAFFFTTFGIGGDWY
jgi:hypothetical protein